MSDNLAAAANETIAGNGKTKITPKAGYTLLSRIGR